MQYNYKYKIWDNNFFPGFKERINVMYNKSYQSVHILSNDRFDEFKNIEDFFTSLEYYYISLMRNGLINRDNFRNVLEKLKSVNCVKTLKKNNERIYGLTIDNDIYLSPKIRPISNLSDSATKQLIISHELGHIINRTWTDKIEELSKDMMSNYKVKEILRRYNLTDKNYIKYGLDLIDEIIAQEVAEQTAYKLDNKMRPRKTIKTDKSYIGNRPYCSNYLFYGEFQEIVTKFARELGFLNCDNKTSDEEVLNRLIREAFSPEFINKLRYELTKDPDRLEEIILMLACMGKLKNGAYAVMGLSTTNEKNVGKYYDVFNYLTSATKNITTSNKKSVY